MKPFEVFEHWQHFIFVQLGQFAGRLFHFYALLTWNGCCSVEILLMSIFDTIAYYNKEGYIMLTHGTEVSKTERIYQVKWQITS